ncbi:Crp/Fnr family transcriptional regulator [Pseudoduganella sp. LjRoot289]|uniref:Crp/Fnr family transcriptional regulator n=1 Tax=Pseudoduganella sp. LjRoot289 TaxID=3342314 RepID=UPI003ECE1A70
MSSALYANPWFSALPDDVREAMLRYAEPVRLRRGEMLFRQGDAPGGLYAVLRGALKISTLREDGREAILGVIEPGTWFGEISLIDKLPRTHDATSVGACELLVLPHEAFHALMERAVFARAVASLLATRLRMMYSMMEDATLRSTRARVVRRLLLLARGDASMARNPRPRIPVSQEALAMMLGISRQTLSKELKLLEGLEAIRIGYRCIELLSEERLRGADQAG